MSFIALHRGAATSLATDQPWLGGDDLTCVQDAAALLQRLEALAAERGAALDQARAEARAEGLAEGKALAVERVAPQLLDAWDQAARRAQADGAELKRAVVTLAIGIVERVAAGLDRADLLAAVARRAAEALPEDQPATLHLHPSLVDAVRARLGAPAFELRADPALGKTDCVFETPAGRLLAGLPAQLARLRKELSE